MNPDEQKEKIRQDILNCCNSSLLKQFDLSLFGDEDPDVFEKIVSFDSNYRNYYAKLSDTLKNNKNIVIQAAKCFSNLALIPEHFFTDKEVIKAILYGQYENHIPEKYLTEDMVNYMFLTCPRSSLKIKPFIDKFLKKETVISVLESRNIFFSRCIKENSYPCIDNIYLPEKMFNDREIVRLLFVSHFQIVKNNPLIDKDLILSLANSEYAIEDIPSSFLNDFELIKQCLKKEENYKIGNNFKLNALLKDKPEVIKELININPKILNGNFDISFDIFKELIHKNINNMQYSKNVFKKDEKKLYQFLTAKEALELFKTNDLDPNSNTYDFSLLYNTHHYYKNPIIYNQFIIEEMARQDKCIFYHIPEELVNDNQFMGKLFFEYGVQYHHEEEDIEAFSNKIYYFGSFEQYLDNLQLEYKLNQDLTQKQNKKKIKI